MLFRSVSQSRYGGQNVQKVETKVVLRHVPAEERRMLSHQVQELKNDRKAGEGRDGMLVLKEVPKDPTYADYAKSVVAKENAARKKLFQEKAEVEGNDGGEAEKGEDQAGKRKLD